MKYKMVALDVDGTLLNNDQKIPEENIKTIRELRRLGVQFVIVTGRPDISVKNYIEVLGIDAPVLGCNGATIRNILTNDLHVLKTLSSESLIELDKYFSSINAYPRFYGIDAVIP